MSNETSSRYDQLGFTVINPQKKEIKGNLLTQRKTAWEQPKMNNARARGRKYTLRPPNYSGRPAIELWRQHHQGLVSTPIAIVHVQKLETPQKSRPKQTDGSENRPWFSFFSSVNWVTRRKRRWQQAEHKTGYLYTNSLGFLPLLPIKKKERKSYGFPKKTLAVTKFTGLKDVFVAAPCARNCSR